MRRMREALDQGRFAAFSRATLERLAGD